MRNLALVLAGWLAGFTGRGTAAPQLAVPGADPYALARQRMVAEQLVSPGRDITNVHVLAVMGKVPRHEFVPERLRADAYKDHPLPIGHGQTISQPYIVAFMTEQLEPKPTDRVLEIGTGSGYQAAVLARLVAQIYTIEIIEELAQRAAADLKRLGYTNVHVRAGDGYQGWVEAAPFDSIIVTCAPERVPQPLIDQLKDGGRIIIPIGPAWNQELVLLRKRGGKLQQHAVLPVSFVPMTGKAKGNPKPEPRSPPKSE
jgi:protein-L-isoaspartate(D-aspartate) O-methyltransferase